MYIFHYVFYYVLFFYYAFFPFHFIEAPSEVLQRLPPHYLEGQRSQDTKIPLRVRSSGWDIDGPVGGT